MTLSSAQIASLHRTLKAGGVSIKLSTLQECIAETSQYSSANAMFAAQISDWGNRKVDLSNAQVIDFSSQEIQGVLDHDAIENSVQDIIDGGLTMPQDVAIEFSDLILSSASWKLADVFGNIMQKSDAVKYIASMPNAPLRVMVNEAMFEHIYCQFLVSFDGVNVVLHNAEDALVNGKPSPISKGKFSSALDFENRINNVCQVFPNVILPFIKLGDKFEYLTDIIESNFYEEEIRLKHSDAKKVLKMDSLNKEFHVGNHLNEMISDADEALNYFKVFRNYPMLIIDASGENSEPAESYLLYNLFGSYALESTDQHPGSNGYISFDNLDELVDALKKLR